MHNNSLELFRLHGLPLIQSGTSVLEIGPEGGGRADGISKDLVVANGGHYNFADIRNNADHQPGFIRMIDEYQIDVEANRFDVVFSLSVAEHVRKIWTWVQELVRITKPGGHVIFVNPVSWPYHASPLYDCWRILPDGYKALFEDFGLEHVFSWMGNVAPLEERWTKQHGPCLVTDTVAVGRKMRL
jgi:SAM-dependent methyltransferase